MPKKSHIWQRSLTISDFFTLPTFYFELMGTWTTNLQRFFPRPLKFLGPLLGNSFRLFVLLVMVHLEIVLYITTVQTYASEGLVEAFLFFLNLVIYFWICCIIAFYATQEGKIKGLFAVMNKEFRLRSAPGLTYVTVEPGYRVATKMLNYWQWSCVFVGSSYALIPLIDGSGQLPIPTWYPFDVHVRFYFASKSKNGSCWWKSSVSGEWTLCIALCSAIFCTDMDRSNLC